MAHYKTVQTRKGPRVQVMVFCGNGPDGRPIQLSKTCDTKREAQKWARDVLSKRDKGELVAGRFTVNNLLDDLELNFKINRKTAWGETMIRAHLRPYFGTMRVDQVTSQTLQRYVAQRQAKGRANGTIAGELTVLKRAFHLGQQCSPPKVGKVPHFPKLQEGSPRQGFFEHDQYQALLQHLPDELKPVLVFAFHTGCRRGEILSLQWPQVDLLESIIRLEPGTTKNKEARTIPLAQDVVQVLLIQRELRDQYHPRCPWVFFRHATGEPLRDFRGSWDAACKKAGLWDDVKKRSTRLLHDLRRTGVRNLVRSGVPEIVAMRISGHKTRSVFDRYNIVSETDLKEAVQRLDGYLAQRRNREEETMRKDCETEIRGEVGDPVNPSNLLN